jgi:hypothetical protein
MSLGNAMYHLREDLSRATQDPSFREMEKDPSEFLRALETHFHFAPIKTLPPDQPPKQDQSNVTSNILCKYSCFSRDKCLIYFVDDAKGKCSMPM